MSQRLSATARREQILDVALQVFASAGFHGASMNDIAEAVGVTKPVLYQHFDSKRDLYQALIDEVGSTAARQHRQGGGRGDRRQEPDRTRVPRLLPVGRRGSRLVPLPVRLGVAPRRGVQRRRAPHHRRGRHRRGAADRRRHRRASTARRWRTRSSVSPRGRAAVSSSSATSSTPTRSPAEVSALAWAGLRAVQPRD